MYNFEYTSKTSHDNTPTKTQPFVGYKQPGQQDAGFVGITSLEIKQTKQPLPRLIGFH